MSQLSYMLWFSFSKSCCLLFFALFICVLHRTFVLLHLTSFVVSSSSNIPSLARFQANCICLYKIICFNRVQDMTGSSSTQTFRATQWVFTFVAAYVSCARLTWVHGRPCKFYTLQSNMLLQLARNMLLQVRLSSLDQLTLLLSLYNKLCAQGPRISFRGPVHKQPGTHHQFTLPVPGGTNRRINNR